MIDEKRSQSIDDLMSNMRIWLSAARSDRVNPEECIRLLVEVQADAAVLINLLESSIEYIQDQYFEGAE